MSCSKKQLKKLLLLFTCFVNLGKSLGLLKTQFSYVPSKDDCKEERKKIQAKKNTKECNSYGLPRTLCFTMSSRCHLEHKVLRPPTWWVGWGTFAPNMEKSKTTFLFLTITAFTYQRHSTFEHPDTDNFMKREKQLTTYA